MWKSITILSILLTLPACASGGITATRDVLRSVCAAFETIDNAYPPTATVGTSTTTAYEGGTVRVEVRKND